MYASFHKSLILLAFGLLYHHAAKAQDIPQIGYKPLSSLLVKKTFFLQEKSGQQEISSAQGSILHPAYYCSQLGLVCKHEIRMDHTFHFPLRFRLGSYDYTQSLEGKH